MSEASRRAPGLTKSRSGLAVWAQCKLIVRLTARELRGGLSGFGLFIGCIALGVGVIAGVNSLADSLLDGFSRQGRVLLGGDVILRRVHRRASSTERSLLGRLGQVSETAMMRAMAVKLGNDDQALVELKGVDSTYPLAGRVDLTSGRQLSTVIGGQGDVAVGQALLDRLGLKIGARLRIGDTVVIVRDVIANEPDKLSSRLPYGPRMMMSIKTLLRTGLVRPGALIKWHYALGIPKGEEAGPGAIKLLREAATKQFAPAGYTILDRRNPSPRISSILNRLRRFLTLLGLTSLLVGGLGVANGVTTYIEKRRRVIATYRSLGASGSVILGTLLLQVMAISSVGVVIGLVAGTALPFAAALLTAGALPFNLAPTIKFSSLGLAATYGFLVALVFALWPLGAAKRVRPASLFREDVGGNVGWPSWPLIVVQGLLVAILIVFAALNSGMIKTTFGFICGTFAILLVFWILGTIVQRLLGILPRPRSVTAKLALTSLASPGGLTRSMIMSLGAGLSLLVGLALVDNSFIHELEERRPAKRPDYFALDIPKARFAEFETLVKARVPASEIRSAPMLRGRIIALDGKPVETLALKQRTNWALRGDRGLTYAETLPEGSKLVAGHWWSQQYSGPPLVSFAAELAQQLGLGLGDSVTVNILGRNVTAHISSLREINWESLALNFVMVFSPNTLAAAPHNFLATIRFPNSVAPEVDAAISRAVSRQFRSVTMIRVADAITAFANIVAKIMIAVRVAGSVTLVAGALVLAGAITAAQHRRTLQAVILKAIGASRRQLLMAHFAEYGVLALVTSALAVLIGSLAAWIITTVVLDMTFVFSESAIGISLLLATALIFALGGYGTWRILSARPVPYLRGL